MGSGYKFGSRHNWEQGYSHANTLQRRIFSIIELSKEGEFGKVKWRLQQLLKTEMGLSSIIPHLTKYISAFLEEMYSMVDNYMSPQGEEVELSSYLDGLIEDLSRARDILKLVDVEIRKLHNIIPITERPLGDFVLLKELDEVIIVLKKKNHSDAWSRLDKIIKREKRMKDGLIRLNSLGFAIIHNTERAINICSKDLDIDEADALDFMLETLEGQAVELDFIIKKMLPEIHEKPPLMDTRGW